jgi:hypothetical protein
MLKKDILWIGVGEAGNRIVNEILGIDGRYVGLYINSAGKDVENLNNIKDLYLIPNSSGTGKNRLKGKQLFVNDRKNIIEQITKYTTQTVLNIVFSMGGGTGSSIAPLLIEGLNILGIKKPINVICVKPGYKENKRYRKNAIECWNELVKLKNINTYYILDNQSRRNPEEINREFARQYDTFMNMPKGIRTDNVIDEEELGTIILCKGSTMFYTFPTQKEDEKVALARAEKNSIFAELDDNTNKCKYLAIAVDKKLYDYRRISQLFDVEEYAVSSYNNQRNELNLVVAAGFKPQKTSMETLEESLQEDVNNLDFQDNSEDLTINTDIKTQQEVVTNIKEKDIDNKDIEDKLNNDDLWEKLLKL